MPYKRAFPTALLLFTLANLALYGLFHQKGLPAAKTLDLNALRRANYEKRQEGPWIWWVLRAYLSQPQTPDLAILGSSQMGSAIFSAEAEHRFEALDTTDQREVTRLTDAVQKLNGKAPQVFNLSMGGAMVSDHYLVAKTLFSGKEKPKAVIIGVNPRDFLDNDLPAASATDAFYFLSPYVDIEELSPVSFDGPFSLLDYKLKKHLPLKQVNTICKGNEPPSLANIATFTNPEGKGSLEKNKSQPLATQVLQAISGSAGDIRQGTWRVPAKPPFSFVDNSREYVRRYKRPNPPCLAGQKAYFQALLSYLKAQDIKVIVVGMPSLESNRHILPASFWTNFKQYLREQTVASGASFVDLFDDQRFVITDYLDTVHLNRFGGAKLISAIAGELNNRPDITAVMPAAGQQSQVLSAGKQKQWQ